MPKSHSGPCPFCKVELSMLAAKHDIRLEFSEVVPGQGQYGTIVLLPGTSPQNKLRFLNEARAFVCGHSAS